MFWTDYIYVNCRKFAFMRRGGGGLLSGEERQSMVLGYEVVLSINYVNADIVMLYEYDGDGAPARKLI